MVKKQIGLLDASFFHHTKSASLREENKDTYPLSFEWKQTSIHETLFSSDGVMNTTRNYKTVNAGKLCGWLIEPRGLRPGNYQAAIENQDKFDYIFTYDRKTLAQLDPKKRRFYVLGGSSIAFDKWKIYPKTRDVCMFYSGKNSTAGHRLRTEIVDQLGGRIDVFGKGVGGEVPSKFEILKHYRYCIVIESGQNDYYFTEKIIDPISVGTIPVYWGCPSISKFFNETGITPLEWILEDGGFDYWLTEERHHNLVASGIPTKNLLKARNYAICEDWMYNTYPEIFND
jgi:hypothetical protein